jgi:hypothetical protein
MLTSIRMSWTLPVFAALPVELACKLQIVHGMDHVKELDRVLCLVRLKMADQMPVCRHAEVLDLLPGFLHPVLA